MRKLLLHDIRREGYIAPGVASQVKITLKSIGE